MFATHSLITPFGFQVQLCDATNNDLERFKFGAMDWERKEKKRARSRKKGVMVKLNGWRFIV